MMVMTRVSERPVTEPAGTIGPLVWVGSLRRERVCGSRPSASSFGGGRRTLDCVVSVVIGP
jgi:hypothetical protein